MGFLDTLALASLLDDDCVDGALGGVSFVAMLFGWGLLAIIKPSVVDQAVMITNVIACVALIFITFTKMYKALKKKKINKKFVIASIIIVSLSFVLGLTINYHSVIFNYEYTKLCSGIALTFIPTLIINLLYPFFYHSEKWEKTSKIKEILASLGNAFSIIITCLVVGQIITIPVGLLGKEQMYNNIATYHNITFNEKRQEIKDMNIDEFLQNKYFEVKDIFNERCKNDNNQNCDKFIKDNYISWLNEYTQDYGYKIFKSKSLNDYEEIIRVVDREYGNEYYSYKIDLNNFSLNKISNEEFLKLLNN